MQSWKRVTGEFLSAGYGVKNSLFGSATGLRILMYHSVSADQKNDESDIYCISQTKFINHLDYLIKNSSDEKFSVRSFNELDKNGIAFTFDDGYRDNLEFAAPLLIERGFPFHVFVNPGFLMSGNKKYLNQASLMELSNLPNVSIGAHGYSHKRLTDCTPSELDNELNSSKKWIEDAIGREVTSMAYPHGAFNDKVQSAVQKAGFKVSACSNFGITNTSSNRYALERTDIWANDTTNTFHSKLRGNWDWMRYM